MKYINKTLTIEKINLQKIANKFGTQFYQFPAEKKDVQNTPVQKMKSVIPCLKINEI